MTTQTETQENILSIKKEVTQVKKLLINEQKKYIGLVLSATGIVFFLISVMLVITLLFATEFKVKILIELIKSGNIFAGVTLGLLTTGMVSFAVGMGINNKE